MYYWKHQHGSTFTYLFELLPMPDQGSRARVHHMIEDTSMDHNAVTFRFTEKFREEVASAGFSMDDLHLHLGSSLMFTYSEPLAVWIRLKYM